ncbi:hypothetical protein ABEX98_14225 [Bacillus subtilis]|nr:hypothetical protein [Bacillus subtilis]MDY7217534.1 hypothetical protein [Bacillus subtilis]
MISFLYCTHIIRLGKEGYTEAQKGSPRSRAAIVFIFITVLAPL